MSQPRLLYSLVTLLDKPDFTPLAHYPSLNQPQLEQAAQKLIAQSYTGADLLRTASSSEINFHLQIQHGIAVIIACTKNMKSRIAFKCIDGIYLRYLREGRPQKKRQVKAILKEEMAKANNLDNDKITQAERNLEEVKAVALENIDKVLQRGDDLEMLDDRAGLLTADALKFKKKTKTLKKTMVLRLILLLVVFLTLLTLIVLILAGVVGVSIFMFVCLVVPQIDKKFSCFGGDKEPASGYFVHNILAKMLGVDGVGGW